MAVLASVAFSLQLLFSSVTIQSYICQPPDKPVISNPSDGSSVVGGSPVVVSGSATADTSVVLTDNGTTFATVTADQANTYAAQTSFTEGSHTLGIAVSSPCGNNTGDTVAITASAPPVPPTPPTPPTPVPLSPSTPSSPSRSPSSTGQSGINGTVGSGGEVPTTESKTKRPSRPSSSSGLILYDIYPDDNTATDKASIFISGRTDEPSTIKIYVKDKVVASFNRAQTSFGAQVPLSVGSNDILIEATSGKQQTSYKLTVVRHEASLTSQPVWYRAIPWIIIISILLVIILLMIWQAVRI